MAETENAAAEAPGGELAKMQAPDGCAGFSFAGVEYPLTKKGIARIPAEAVADAQSHGFVLLDPVGPLSLFGE